VSSDARNVRALQHATGIKDQAISKSISGNSSKIHLGGDSNGNPVLVSNKGWHNTRYKSGIELS